MFSICRKILKKRRGNFWISSYRLTIDRPSASLPPGVISKSGFQYGKFANNLFSILKLLVTVPKMGKIQHISNMTVWDKMAIFETTAKNSVLERSVQCTDLKYEKKWKNSIEKKSCPKIMKFRYFAIFNSEEF